MRMNMQGWSRNLIFLFDTKNPVSEIEKTLQKEGLDPKVREALEKKKDILSKNKVVRK